jgi:hypothetical protein
MVPNGSIGQIYCLQPFLRRAIAAVCVGVVTFGQLLIAGLHGLERHRPFKPESREWFPQVDWNRRLGAFGASGPSACQAFQWVSQGILVQEAGAKTAEWPRRTLPLSIGAGLSFDLARCHTLVKIPSRVVGADMVQTIPPVLIERRARLRCAVFARARTSWEVAGSAWRVRIGRVGPGSRRASGHPPLCASAANWGKPREDAIGLHGAGPGRSPDEARRPYSCTHATN